MLRRYLPCQICGKLILLDKRYAGRAKSAAHSHCLRAEHEMLLEAPVSGQKPPTAQPHQEAI
jgi:hypothetical protein